VLFGAPASKHMRGSGPGVHSQGVHTTEQHPCSRTALLPVSLPSTVGAALCCAVLFYGAALAQELSVVVIALLHSSF
jgi:small neutral amino acid transporter SnatA (MarC family)